MMQFLLKPTGITSEFYGKSINWANSHNENDILPKGKSPQFFFIIKIQIQGQTEVNASNLEYQSNVHIDSKDELVTMLVIEGKRILGWNSH